MKKLHALLGAVVLSTAATQASADIVYQIDGVCDLASFLCSPTVSGISPGEQLSGFFSFVDGAADDGVFTTAEVIDSSIGGVVAGEVNSWHPELGDTFSGTGDATNLFSFTWVTNGGPIQATATFDSAAATYSINGFVLGSGVSYTTSAVPVPAAAWLFGSAMLGLVGVGRKRRA